MFKNLLALLNMKEYFSHNLRIEGDNVYYTKTPIVIPHWIGVFYH